MVSMSLTCIFWVGVLMGRLEVAYEAVCMGKGVDEEYYWVLKLLPFQRYTVKSVYTN